LDIWQQVTREWRNQKEKDEFSIGPSGVHQDAVHHQFDVPRELVWKAWTDPKYVMQWWGPKGFSCPACEIDFRVGGKFRFCMRMPDGQEGWNGGEYHEIVLHEKIVYSMYFSDPQGNKIEPEELGIEPESGNSDRPEITHAYIVTNRLGKCVHER
jgi:uncharacterized protein YndB with AHSA1/START domain